MASKKKNPFKDIIGSGKAKTKSAMPVEEKNAPSITGNNFKPKGGHKGSQKTNGMGKGAMKPKGMKKPKKMK